MTYLKIHQTSLSFSTRANFPYQHPNFSFIRASFSIFAKVRSVLVEFFKFRFRLISTWQISLFFVIAYASLLKATSSQGVYLRLRYAYPLVRRVWGLLMVLVSKTIIFGAFSTTSFWHLAQPFHHHQSRSLLRSKFFFWFICRVRDLTVIDREAAQSLT